MLTVESLHIYPVKSLGGISLDQTNCTEFGLELDRRWVIVDQNNHFLTQRQLPQMASIQLALDSQSLVFSHHEAGSQSLNIDDVMEADTEITVWKDNIAAKEVVGPINQWLNQALGEYRKGPLKLMQFTEQTVRVVAEKYLPEKDSKVSFADACPYLLTFQESLHDLNRMLPVSMPMDRFRANIVLSGAAPWQEYQWQRIENDAITFALIGPCQRCQMTSIDQQSGKIATPGEPLQTLMKQFPVKDQKLPFFGQHARLLGTPAAKLKVGDKFTWN